ncbi:hypothetical protein SDC9_202009 [bioreactor metagenome]|uniref:Uncharacterized protein n=1 Tax=bioreactor metagenome TaxID=1076179 RepID=A0A645IV87_9ZZZZ
MFFKNKQQRHTEQITRYGLAESYVCNTVKRAALIKYEAEHQPDDNGVEYNCGQRHKPFIVSEPV